MFLHFPSTSIFSAITSISPVFMFLFLLLLSTTFPSTCIQLSVVNSFACSCNFSSFIIICVIPNSSLRSINSIPPRFLFFCIQPASSTFSPALLMFSSPHVFVLYILIPLFNFIVQLLIVFNFIIFYCVFQ